MIRFLTTSGIASHIEDLIRTAESRVVLVSPYLQFSENFVHRLMDADSRGVEVAIIYGKDRLSDEVRDVLGKLNRLRLHYYEHLHAKCYLNEHEMVIGSMNLYEYSEKKNREMGVLVTSDEEVYQEAVAEVASIVRASKRQQVKGPRQKAASGGLAEVLGLPQERKEIHASNGSTNGRRRRRNPKAGHCIRCRGSINHNPSVPYCPGCYDVWAKHNNPEWPERFCHTCGENADTKRFKPRCTSCYNATVRA